jgi:hypothetical protein
VDQPSVSLHDGKGHSLADGVKYTLGSSWVPVPAAEQTFSAVADSTLASGAAARPWQPGGGVLASSPFTPPQSPQVFTTFFLGSASFGYSLLPQVDAPETGRGRPPAAAAARPLHAPLPQRSPPTPRPAPPTALPVAYPRSEARTDAQCAPCPPTVQARADRLRRGQRLGGRGRCRPSGGWWPPKQPSSERSARRSPHAGCPACRLGQSW